MKRCIWILGASVVAMMLLAGCMRLDYDAQIDQPAIIAALEDTGVQICSQSDLDWTITPGFVEGKSLIVGLDCSDTDAARPEARVFIARFDSKESREGALRNFETINRRSLGPGIASGVGPWIVVVDGEQSPGVAIRLREAMTKLTAR